MGLNSSEPSQANSPMWELRLTGDQAGSGSRGKATTHLVSGQAGDLGGGGHLPSCYCDNSGQLRAATEQVCSEPLSHVIPV